MRAGLRLAAKQGSLVEVELKLSLEPVDGVGRATSDETDEINADEVLSLWVKVK